MRAATCFALPAALAAAPALAQGQPMCGTAVMIANAPRDLDNAIRTVDRQESQATQAQRRQAYQDNLRQRREQAEQYAAAARQGVALPPDAAETLRGELQADIEQWRAEFTVSRKEWQAMREQWLVSRDSLTSAQWAERRADWWSARDAWIARNRPPVAARAR